MGEFGEKRGRAQSFDMLKLLCYLKKWCFCEMVILVVFNSFNVVKNLKKPDLVARQMPPLYTTHIRHVKWRVLGDIDAQVHVWSLCWCNNIFWRWSTGMGFKFSLKI